MKGNSVKPGPDETEARGGKARVLIVDDHHIVREGLKQMLGGELPIEICGEAEDAPAALLAIRAHKPDLAIVDLSLKGSNGLELIKQIRASYESTRVLVLSMHSEMVFAERALRAGASGYVEKTEPCTTVVEAVLRILSGKRYLSARMTERLVGQVVRNGGHADVSPVETLSDRELEVFELLGQGRTTSQIADSLSLSVKTVETYRRNLMRKLDLDTANELVHHAVQWSLAQS
jgi:DNA-binding NarL/FixJ family response regulator